MDDIKKFGVKIRSMQEMKRKAIEEEDFDRAKEIKHNIEKHKLEIEEILSSPQGYNYSQEMGKESRGNYENDLNDPNDN